RATWPLCRAVLAVPRAGPLGSPSREASGGGWTRGSALAAALLAGARDGRFRSETCWVKGEEDGDAWSVQPSRVVPLGLLLGQVQPERAHRDPIGRASEFHAQAEE